MLQLFEVELRLAEGSEVLFKERPLTQGERIIVDGVPWCVRSTTRPQDPRARTRYVCVPVRAAARV